MTGSSGGPFRLPGSLEPAHEERRLAPVTPPPAVWIDWGPPVPDSWRQDRIELLVRDPWWIFAYWELTGPHADWVPRMHGADIYADSRWIVRLFRDGVLTLELPASHPLGSWYFQGEPDRAWRAQIGLLAASGAWIPVATSGEVRTPRASIAEVVDEEWPVTEEDILVQLGFSAGEAARRAEFLRRGEGARKWGYPGAMPGPGPSSGR